MLEHNYVFLALKWDFAAWRVHGIPHFWLKKTNFRNFWQIPVEVMLYLAFNLILVWVLLEWDFIKQLLPLATFKATTFIKK